MISKKQLRKAIKDDLLSISQQELNRQSACVRKALSTIPEFAKARSVALYMNMPTSEIKTLPIIEDCFSMNKRLYLPKCVFSADNGRKMNHLNMLEVKSFDEILHFKPQGKYNLLEPVDGNEILQSEGGLDVIMVPGVAFSSNRKRLGHGAGFYDEFLTVYKAKFKKSPFIIGIGLKEQLMEDIPTEEHDWDLDCIVIENDIYR